MGWWNEFQDTVKYYGMPARELTKPDFEGWMQASDDRPTVNSLTADQLRAYLKAKNPWRWRRLQRDFKWTQKKLQKLGYNPEDARFLL